MLPSKTLAARAEAAAPGYKGSKERVTILAWSNATGNHKLRLTFIGKAKAQELSKPYHLVLYLFRTRPRGMLGCIQQFSEAAVSMNFFLQLTSFEFAKPTKESNPCH